MSRASETIEHEPSCGNVFADLGLPDAEERLVKSELAIAIARVIEGRHLTQTAAAELTGLAQPKISDITRGRLEGYSIERLMECLTALQQDVLITIRPAATERGTILVTAG
jgi:predicted XRE-type DNA-binding protein